MPGISPDQSLSSPSASCLCCFFSHPSFSYVTTIINGSICFSLLHSRLSPLPEHILPSLPPFFLSLCVTFFASHSQHFCPHAIISSHFPSMVGYILFQVETSRPPVAPWMKEALTTLQTGRRRERWSGSPAREMTSYLPKSW